MRRLILAGLATLTGATAAAAPPERASLPKAWAAFEARFRGRLAALGVVGASLTVVDRSGIVLRAQHGLRDRDPGRPVDEDTAFHWASITKTFTSIAIMQLRDRGRLALDEPAVKYLPELRQVHDPFGDVSEITIRHLMTHSAGFRAGTWPWGGGEPWHPFEPTRYEQLVAMLPYTEVQFRPGSRHSYSNPGIVFLGRIIELLTGEDYEVYIEKNVLRPLGMRESYFDRAPYHLLERRSHSYSGPPGALRERPFDFDTGVTVSNGGLNGPLTDMARYLAFLMGAPGDARYEGVLKRTSLEEMFQAQVPTASEDPGQEAIGLSFFLERRGGRRLVAHSGDQAGFISHLYLDPQAKVGYVVGFNTDVVEGERSRTRELDAAIRDDLLAEVFPALAAQEATPKLQ